MICIYSAVCLLSTACKQKVEKTWLSSRSRTTKAVVLNHSYFLFFTFYIRVNLNEMNEKRKEQDLQKFNLVLKCVY